MQTAALVAKIVNIAESHGNAEQVEDAIVAHITRSLRDGPSGNPADLVHAEGEAVAQALQSKGLSFDFLGQVYDTFRAEQKRYSQTAAESPAPSPLAVGLTPPRSAPATASVTGSAVTSAPAMGMPVNRHAASCQSTQPYVSRSYASTPYAASVPYGSSAFGTNSAASAMLSMDAMQADMNAMALETEGAALAAQGDGGAALFLEEEGALQQNAANMDRMLARGTGTNTGTFGAMQQMEQMQMQSLMLDEMAVNDAGLMNAFGDNRNDGFW